ncbi:MAG: type II toxin-antitoxin system RelE/ParE family toxin [Limnohabitans sp.]|jgi:hypothetical protein|nr:type II toxin-antitoxin system RelE/ParE family toxin [Limnohabitans sp.]
MWEIELLPEFAEWWRELPEETQQAISHDMRLLAMRGPMLGRPLVDTIHGSRFPNMKELRTMHLGRQFRTFFAFDPRRRAIVLIGGDKTGDARFYDRMIVRADALFAEHLYRLAQGRDGSNDERNQP